jgi:hypothetical protein
MKFNFPANVLLALTLAALSCAIFATPPGNAPWSVFLNDPASTSAKLFFLIQNYAWPGVLAYLAILLFQLQFRLLSTGLSGRMVFVLCTWASAAMLAGFSEMASRRGSAPFYVVGMALANVTMSRLYAVRLRVFGKIRIPWPIWRDNAAAVEAVNRQMLQRHDVISGVHKDHATRHAAAEVASQE